MIIQPPPMPRGSGSVTAVAELYRDPDVTERGQGVNSVLGLDNIKLLRGKARNVLILHN